MHKTDKETKIKDDPETVQAWLDAVHSGSACNVPPVEKTTATEDTVQ